MCVQILSAYVFFLGGGDYGNFQTGDANMWRRYFGDYVTPTPESMEFVFLHKHANNPFL